MSNNKISEKSPKGRLVEIDGIRYQIIKGKLYRYADLTMDKGFKIVLGRIGSEEVLKHLLNRLLRMRISRLEYRNTEHPGITEEDRFSRFDVYCEDENGVGFQVEMQNWAQKHFHKRAAYYSALVLLDQAAKSQKEQRLKVDKKYWKWDYNYNSQYVVSFLNFNNLIAGKSATKINEYISTYRYVDIETKDELGDGTNLVFIDLYGFQKNIDECESLEDIWMYSIKNMFNLDECPDKIRGTEIEELYLQSELANMTVEQRIKIEESIMTQNDILNSIAEQVEEARKEAREKGIDVGKAVGRIIGLEEGRIVGLEEGRIAGLAEGLSEGRIAGLEEGKAQGLAEGHIAGLEEGKAQGRAEGKMQASMEIAKKLLAAGMTKEQISEITGLNIDEL